MANTHVKSLFLFSLLLTTMVSSSSGFDIFQLAIQWDPATCSDRTLSPGCTTSPHDKFSIRGLWPTSYPWDIAGPCNGSIFSPSIIHPIEGTLNRDWPNLLTGNNRQLWEDEWRNHGSCSEGRLDQLQYFTFAANSFNQHDLHAILANNNIRPDRRNYFFDAVNRAITRAIGVRAALFCNFNSLTNSRQLHQIRLCYNRDWRAPINCWTSLGNCPNSFAWFPYMTRLYTYFQVAFQWQPATCFNSVYLPPCSRTPEPVFSLDGVWPTTSNDAILGPCAGSSFDAGQLSHIWTRLNRAWPDLVNGRNERIWENEWRSRGTCSEDQFGQLQYFNFGVHVFERHDIVSILKRNNITPNGGSYRREDVINAIIRTAGRRPTLSCIWRRENSTSFREISQLHRIIFCYDEFLRQYQDCPIPAVPVLPTCPLELFWFP